MGMSRMKSWGILKRCGPYLRGAFMASGSVNNPETSRYHLEIFSIYEQHNQDICDMLELLRSPCSDIGKT